ncbi:MAG: hypothetical protein LBO04_02475 [Spirochaetaceae bacterium]|jgi:rhodanese-related sulfurtransferase|nr:hypothetical protein [Spirochaetaceae bacterium]
MANYNEEAVWEGVRELEETDDCEAGVFNIPFRQLTHRTAKVKELVEAEAATRTAENAALAGQVQSAQGRGGPLTAHDFGSAAPGQEEITRYACEDIWNAGGTFVWDAENPRESTYTVETDGGQTVHTAGEIFNSTWIRNTYNGINHRIVLTNTPNTEPSVFSWADVGYDTVGIATEGLPGLVRSGGDVEVDPVTGIMRITQTAQTVQTAGEGRGAFLTASDKRGLVIRGGTSVKTGTGEDVSYFVTADDMTLDVESLLDVGAALANGKDYYVFVCRSGNGFEMKVSLEKAAPAGFDATVVKLIGGFHTLCANAGAGMTYVFGGETHEHPLNGYIAGDILPQ